MNLKESLPPKIASIILPRIVSANDIQIALPSDIGADGRFGTVWLVATAEKLLVVPERDGSPTIGAWIPTEPREIPVKEIKSVKSDSLVGSSRLVAELDGRKEVLLYYSGALASKFGEAAWAP